MPSKPKSESKNGSLPIPLSHVAVRELFLKKVCSLKPEHKGDRGHLAVIAGGAGTAGAALLTARSGFRAGAGLVTLVSDTPVLQIAVAHTPELMTADLAAYLSSESSLAEFLDRAVNTIVIGPGLMNAECIFEECLKRSAKAKIPMLIDASGLRYLAANPALKRYLSRSSLLTPHPGELAALLDISVVEVQKDRVRWAKEAASEYGCTVVLKGAHTVIAGVHGKVFVSPWTNANLATAGSGDVLSGLIGGLIARKVTSLEAAIIAVYIHGWSGATLLKQQILGSLASEFAEDFPRRCGLLIEG